METIEYPNFPATVHVALFTSVSNAAQIRSRIVKAATAEGPEGDAERNAVKFAFIEARLVASRRHLLTAVYQSLLAESQQALKTKSVHSEIIWSLNPTNNITEALRRYGVSDKSSTLLAVQIGDQSDRDVVEKNMKSVIDGQLEELNDLPKVTDWTSIAKYYKLNTKSTVVAEKDVTKRNSIIEELVTSFVAMKSVMA